MKPPFSQCETPLRTAKSRMHSQVWIIVIRRGVHGDLSPQRQDTRNFARCATCAVMAEADCRSVADANTVCATCGMPMVFSPSDGSAISRWL